jgi:hypothetical protein
MLLCVHCVILIFCNLQLNCQTCEIDKSSMDNLEPSRCRHKQDVAQKVVMACQEGLYPGWEQEPGAQDWPRPIFWQSGHEIKYSLERVKRAEKVLGVKLVANSTWLFPHFDCYIQVLSTLTL